MASYCLKLLVLPCKAFALGCEACGAGCDLCCSALDTACGRCCSAPYACFCPSDRPSPIFLTYTFLMNTASCVAAVVVAALNFHNDCAQPLQTFLLIMALVFNPFMIGFAIRIYVKFSEPADVERGAVPTSTCDKAWQLCCYEPAVCAYFVFAPAAIAWSIVGLAWTSSSVHRRSSSSTDVHCPESLITMSNWAAGLMLVYLAGTIVVVALSLCVECARVTDRRMQHSSQQSQQAGLGMAPAQANNAYQASIPYAIPGAALVGSLLYPQAMHPSRPGYQPAYAPAPPPPPVTPYHPPPPQQFAVQATAAGPAFPAQPAWVQPAPAVGGQYSPTHMQPQSQPQYPQQSWGNGSPPSHQASAQPSAVQTAEHVARLAAEGLGKGMEKLGGFLQQASKPRPKH